MDWSKIKRWLRAIATFPFAVVGLTLILVGIIIKAIGFLCVLDTKGAELETRGFRR